MAKLGSLIEMMREFGRVADFVVVYIQEAHPIDGWHFKGMKYNIKRPKTIDNRMLNASLLSEELGKDTCPLLIDCMDNQACLSYGAMPERLYVVENGMITYNSPKGTDGYLTGLTDIRSVLSKKN